MTTYFIKIREKLRSTLHFSENIWYFRKLATDLHNLKSLNNIIVLYSQKFTVWLAVYFGLTGIWFGDILWLTNMGNFFSVLNGYPQFFTLMLQEKYSHHQIHHLWKPHQVHIRQILTKQFVMFCGFFMILKKHQKVDKNARIFYVLHCMLIMFHLRPLNKSICISIVSLVLTYIWTLLQVTNMFVFVKKCGCFVKKQNPLYFKNSFQLISKFWLVMKSYRNYMHLKYLKNNIWNNVGKHNCDKMWFI